MDGGAVPACGPRTAAQARWSSAPVYCAIWVFSSCDGRQILISIQNEREWEQLCARVLQEPALLHDERFATNVARVEHRAETDGKVGARFGAIESSELVARLTEADIAFCVRERAGRPSQAQPVAYRLRADACWSCGTAVAGAASVHISKILWRRSCSRRGHRNGSGANSGYEAEGRHG
jgi:crotonobetainyl-CoA:carnitine CoA-transferase CaiB-like acyl-CoA transferase